MTCKIDRILIKWAFTFALVVDGAIIIAIAPLIFPPSIFPVGSIQIVASYFGLAMIGVGMIYGLGRFLISNR